METPDNGPRTRILIAKPGLDGHDRGAKFIAQSLREAGYEVIYTGIRQTPEAIAHAAIQEDVHLVGLSILSGAHMELLPAVIECLREAGGEHVTVFLGGIIPEQDIPFLLDHGVSAVYGPNTPVEEILRFVESHAALDD